jgi:hypothetical protein
MHYLYAKPQAPFFFVSSTKPEVVCQSGAVQFISELPPRPNKRTRLLEKQRARKLERGFVIFNFNNAKAIAGTLDEEEAMRLALTDEAYRYCLTKDYYHYNTFYQRKWSARSEHILLSSCLLPSRPSWMLSAKKASRHEDDNGVDVIVSTALGDICLQAKSSVSGARKFIKQHFLVKKRFYIGLVKVGKEDTAERILKKVIGEVEKLLKGYYAVRYAEPHQRIRKERIE